MPGGDRTGPRGEGSRTGWGLGLCEGDDQPGNETPRPYARMGRGFRGGGRNFGGRGWRNRRFDSNWGDNENFTPTSNPQTQEIEAIKAQNQELQNILQKILSRLDNLEA